MSMRITSLFEGLKIPPNTAPPVVPMTAHIFQNTILPIGVFYVREKVRGGGETGVASPFALALKVTWIAEPGVMYCDGQVVAVGKAYDTRSSMSNRHASDPDVNTSETLLDAIKGAIGGTDKVEFVEFVNDFYEALRRSAAIPMETADRLREKLVRASAEHQFVIAKTEEELDALIEAHREAAAKSKS